MYVLIVDCLVGGALVGAIPPNLGLALVFLRAFRRVQVHGVAKLWDL